MCISASLLLINLRSWIWCKNRTSAGDISKSCGLPLIQLTAKK